MTVVNFLPEENKKVNVSDELKIKIDAIRYQHDAWLNVSIIDNDLHLSKLILTFLSLHSG